MPYKIAGIDVHKRMLAVVVADVEGEGDFHFERHKVGTSPAELRALAGWLVERQVDEVVMESTAQYWRPVWEALELHWRPQRRTRDGASPLSGTLHLAQAQSNRGAISRKKDFPDAERLVKRLVAQELTLSFVPDAEQRLWRTVMRRKYQITRSRVQLHNRLESLLEEAHIKVSSVVSDLLGTSARRMLQALADGERDPAAEKQRKWPVIDRLAKVSRGDSRRATPAGARHRDPDAQRSGTMEPCAAIVYGGRVGCLSLAYRSVRTDERRRVGHGALRFWTRRKRVSAVMAIAHAISNRKQKTCFDKRQNPRSRSVARDNWCQQFEQGASCHCSRRVEPAIQQPSDPWHHDRQSCLCRHRIHTIGR